MARQKSNGKREFYVIIEEGENGYYVAEVPELRGCYTQAKTLDELMVRVKEVIQLCLEEDEEEEGVRAEPKPRIIGDCQSLMLVTSTKLVH
ncbi:MAG TPA: type II toxin-antitoxin system HicB family antitoxin, partial [Desulfobacterales bacterium]|nr:type II toxin-antitoxin system HicB family antitoxin [Desulfobacterales bacterium]